MSRSRSALLAPALIITLVLQLATPALAFADDDVPPPDPPSEEPAATEAGTDAGIVEDSPDPVAAEPTPAEVLAGIPEGTAVLVVDESGEPEPLTTPEAAETILTSDPVWCSAGYVPADDPTGGTYCTPPQTTVTDLLNVLGANQGTYLGDGTIFFTTNYSTNDAYISGSDARTAALLSLGVDGMGNSLTVPLEITHWLYDVQVDDLSLSGAGLRVETEGAIQVSNVTVSGSPGAGAYLDSNGGAPSDVTVISSQLNNNTFTGLDVRSDDDIDLMNVTANANQAGAYLDASAGSGNVMLDASSFTGNAAAGLTARTSDGFIFLSSVSANGSTNADSYGAGLTSTGGGDIDVTISGFSSNGGNGLWIEGSGSVRLEGISASNNGLHGAYVHNVNACAAVPLPVDVEGGTFDGNGGYGVLAVLGPGGTLNLVNHPVFGLPTFSGNGAGDYLEDLSACPPCQDKPEGKPYNVVHVPETGGDPIPLDCENYAGTVLILPNGDRATLVCPVEGEATLELLPGDGLPGALPPGRTYVSGVDVGLAAEGAAIQAISEGGYITLAFLIPEGWDDASLAVLYWDSTANAGAGGWVELPPYAMRPDGSPMIHSLHPDADPADGMFIRGGVRVLTEYVKVSVNFPGIFVLAAR